MIVRITTFSIFFPTKLLFYWKLGSLGGVFLSSFHLHKKLEVGPLLLVPLATPGYPDGQLALNMMKSTSCSVWKQFSKSGFPSNRVRFHGDFIWDVVFDEPSPRPDRAICPQSWSRNTLDSHSLFNCCFKKNTKQNKNGTIPAKAAFACRSVGINNQSSLAAF